VLFRSQLPSRERTLERARELRKQANDVFREMVGIEVVDEVTFRVRLVRPTPYFLDLCAFPSFYAVHPETVERFVAVDASSGAIRQDHQWTKPGRIVCNGPYLPVRWRFKREMRLERNPEYWNPSLAKSDTITIIPIEEENTGVVAYETGVFDWHSDVLVDYIPDMLEQKARGERDNIHSLQAFGTYFWSFNCSPRLSDGRENPFHDARVRKAFAMSVNKRDIMDKIKRTGEVVADVFVPPGSIPGYESPGGVGMDIDAARTLARRTRYCSLGTFEFLVEEAEPGSKIGITTSRMVCSGVAPKS